jgi:hypothetical protein
MGAGCYRTGRPLHAYSRRCIAAAVTVSWSPAMPRMVAPGADMPGDTAGYHPILANRAIGAQPAGNKALARSVLVRSGVNRYAVVRRISFIWPAAAGDVSHTSSVASEQTSGPRQRATRGKRHRVSCPCCTPESRPMVAGLLGGGGAARASTVAAMAIRRQYMPITAGTVKAQKARWDR